MYLYSAITWFTRRRIINTRKHHLLPPAGRHARFARRYRRRIFPACCSPGLVCAVDRSGCGDRCDRADGDRILAVTAVWPVPRGRGLVGVVGVVALVSGSSGSCFAGSASPSSYWRLLINTERQICLSVINPNMISFHENVWNFGNSPFRANAP